MNLLKFSCFIFLSMLLFSSCAEIKPLPVYFNNIGDTTLQCAAVDLEPIIQKNDLLNVTVSSPNPEASMPFNAGGTTASAAAGYLVDQQGNIQFPYIGNIKAAGLSKKQLQQSIRQEILNRKLLVEPIVSVRYINYKVTVVGEVARPTVIPVPGEKINIVEAIGLAGDLTPYGKMDNILLIREEEGKKTTHRLNLNNPAILTSPFYYLKSNDIVYVEPTKEKAEMLKKPNNLLPTIISAVSLAVIILDRFIK